MKQAAKALLQVSSDCGRFIAWQAALFALSLLGKLVLVS